MTRVQVRVQVSDVVTAETIPWITDRRHAQGAEGFFQLGRIGGHDA